MADREYGLVHNPSDPPRFIRLCTYERTASFLVPVLETRERLDVSNPRQYGYHGPEWKWVPTAVTELLDKSGAGIFDIPVWPREAPTETEVMRRRRIQVIRRAVHVDPKRGEAQPRWVEHEGL